MDLGTDSDLYQDFAPNPAPLNLPTLAQHIRTIVLWAGMFLVGTGLILSCIALITRTAIR